MFQMNAMIFMLLPRRFPQRLARTAGEVISPVTCRQLRQLPTSEQGI
jgi:hypothetical protein